MLSPARIRQNGWWSRRSSSGDWSWRWQSLESPLINTATKPNLSRSES